MFSCKSEETPSDWSNIMQQEEAVLNSTTILYHQINGAINSSVLNHVRLWLLPLAQIRLFKILKGGGE